MPNDIIRCDPTSGRTFAYARDRFGNRPVNDFLTGGKITPKQRRRLDAVLRLAMKHGKVSTKLFGDKFEEVAKRESIWLVHVNPINILAYKRDNFWYALTGYSGGASVPKDELDRAIKGKSWHLKYWAKRNNA